MKGPRKSAPITSGGPGTLGRLRKDFGFKDGVSGAHAARTLMLADFSILLGAATGEAKREDFKGAGNIFEINFRQLLTPKEIQASHGPN